MDLDEFARALAGARNLSLAKLSKGPEMKWLKDVRTGKGTAASIPLLADTFGLRVEHVSAALRTPVELKAMPPEERARTAQLILEAFNPGYL
jgi:hypothetical protein